MSQPKVELLQGILVGSTKATSEGFKYECFQGIPYGKPPVGELRFKDPLPAEPWEGIRDGAQEGGVCPQLDPVQEVITGEEDCLYLNVYVPHIEQQKSRLPVMVWVHGGGFYKGSGNFSLYGPDFIIEKNVICVTLNYRFSVLGFLCLHTPSVPGNAGLKDIILSLKWIQNNIQFFGGDPDNVTIFGESAGAVSIHYLSLSPLARGLFHKAIIQSGSALCQWASIPNSTFYAYKLAKALGSDNSDINEVLGFLQNVSLNDLLHEASKIITPEDNQKYFPCAFLPVIEGRYDGVESVINEDPESIIKSGKFNDIPLMAGYSSKESVFMFERISCDPNRVNELVGDLQYFLPANLNLVYNSEKSLSIADELKKYYFKDRNVSAETVHGVIDLLSDFLFRHPVDLTVRLLAEHSSSPVYYFQFSYLGNLSRCKKCLAKLRVQGAAHSEENGYIFRKQNLEAEEILPADALVRKRLVKMWTDFAKYGNPTPKKSKDIDTLWEPATKEKLNYIEINNDITLAANPNSDALNFWIHLRDDFDNE